jgi:hypothetical protein
LLEFGEEVLDQMPFFVEVPVVVARRTPVGLRRDDSGPPSGGQRLADPFVGIERLIADQRVGLHIRQEVVSTD